MSALPSMWARIRRVPAPTIAWFVFAAVSLPFVVAVLALIGDDWFPVLDLAMTELRVRDVFTGETPLIGLPGRIGRFPDQGSHPGPLSFYLLAPVYRLFGSSSFGLEVATVLLGIGAVAVVLWLARRRGGVPMLLVTGAVLAILVRGYGFGERAVLVQPWNPYLPLLFWLVVLFAAWSVFDGEQMMLVVVVAAGSLCAQTHVPYLGLVLGVTAACVAWQVVTWFRHSMHRNPIVHAWQWSLTVIAILWSPVVIDQLASSPGNISMLRDHFASPDEPVVGFGEGAALVLRHFDVFRLPGEALDGDEYLLRAGFDLTGSTLPGLLVMLTWLAAFGAAISLRHRKLVALHSVLVAATVLGWISMSRIFGKVWYYLTLWAWATTVLAVVATLWTLVVVVDRWWPRSRTTVRASLGSLAAVAGVVSLVAVTVEAVDVRPAEDHLGDTLGAVLDPTEEAIRLGTGPAEGEGATYLVVFRDAHNFGSQAYGLVSELERRGLNVGMSDTYRVPITEHRVVSEFEAVAEIHLVTGMYIDEYRSDPDAVEVAFHEPRSDADLEEYARLADEVTARLGELGLDELLPEVEGNLFRVQLDERSPPDVQQLVDRMLRLGTATAVFLVPVSFAS